MATARPIAYNTGAPIPGTNQIGNLAIGVDNLNYSQGEGGVRWWNGPNEDLGYCIGYPQAAGTQPTPEVPTEFAYIQFWRSKLLTEASFVELSNYIANGAQVFTGGTQAKTWLNANGYWTSFADTYNYNPSVFLPWPSSSAGYTLYNGGFTSADDGFSNSPITLPTTFKTDGQSSSNLYLSTNGYFTLGSGSAQIIYTPQDQSNPAAMCGNPGDNWMQPGLTMTDGDVQNWYYQTGSDGGGKYYVKLLVYQGQFGNNTFPLSYVLNFYRDEQYQWLESRIKANQRGNAGPYNITDVSQGASTTSRVWRGNLNGQNWVYMGTGTVQL